MRQSPFEATHAREWDEFEAFLEQKKSFDPAEMPSRFRRVCQNLALAAERRYSADLVDRLNRLALRGHHALYVNRRRESQQVLEFMLAGFPRLVRQEWRLVAAATLLFFGPLLGLLGLLQVFPDFVHYLLAPEQIANFHAMYDPANRRIGMREADTNVMMFGFYIWNNVRIGFQTFAGGILFGLGTVFYLLYNGLVIGAVTGYLVQAGLGTNFFSFTSGHSAFELTAIVLCGAAGLRIGYALIAPGRRRRVEALRTAAYAAMPLVIGSSGMLVLAAGIEAFWSPRTELPLQIKYAFGLGLWLLTLAYFGMMGRRSAA